MDSEDRPRLNILRGGKDNPVIETLRKQQTASEQRLERALVRIHAERPKDRNVALQLGTQLLVDVADITFLSNQMGREMHMVDRDGQRNKMEQYYTQILRGIEKGDFWQLKTHLSRQLEDTIPFTRIRFHVAELEEIYPESLLAVTEMSTHIPLSGFPYQLPSHAWEEIPPHLSES